MENSKIEWTDHTMNFWVGCTKVSPACDHCYAESWARRTGHAELWGGERRRTSVANWRKPSIWDRKLNNTGRRKRVFTNSLADFFDNQVPQEWRADAWEAIWSTAYLDWLILTKRPQNIAKMLPHNWGDGWPNVWLGTTAENQEEYDRRVPYLNAAPAAVHFVSYEPALGPLHLSIGGHRVDWIIAGGESGPHARQCDVAWFRELRDDCSHFGIKFFMKQMGGKRKPFLPIPDDLMVREFPRC